MSILVVCPGCKAEFKVSDKFAGKTGPCPKCKAKISIPAQVEEEVKVHAPDDAPATSAAAQARIAAKPIARQETQFGTTTIVILVIGVIVTFVAARVGAGVLANVILRGALLALVSVPICAAGYSFLREDELEPYRGRSLWLRSTLCGALYAALWASMLYIPADFVRDLYAWFFIAPPLLLAGTGIAFVSYDFDFGTGFMHYAFYIVVTMALGWTAGLAMPWNLAAP